MRLEFAPEFWRTMTEIAAWGLAAAWCARTTHAIRNLPLMPNLTSLDWDVAPDTQPSLTVIVPARDEAANIAATLDTLMQQDYPHIRVIAINDRSTDTTGAILDSYALRYSGRVSVLHITELPPGWLGKTHAMAQGLAASEQTALAQERGASVYVLFTDADVLFSPSVLRRALAYAEGERADHLVTVPTMQVRQWSEGVVLGFFQIFGLWASRPWRVADAEAKRDVVGIGAFNLLRRDALEGIGGLGPQRLSVLEDITLGRRVKAAGLRQRVAFAPGLVLVHWAAGARGLIKVMSKNLFSAFNYRPTLALAGCAWIVVFCLMPVAGLAWWWTLAPALLVLACISVVYRMYGELSGIDPRYGWAYPLGAAMFCYAIVRSVVVVWKDGGVMWRGTLYPLGELRKHNDSRQWRKSPTQNQ